MYKVSTYKTDILLFFHPYLQEDPNISAREHYTVHIPICYIVSKRLESKSYSSVSISQQIKLQRVLHPSFEHNNKQPNNSFPIVVAAMINEHELVFTLLTQKNCNSHI